MRSDTHFHLEILLNKMKPYHNLHSCTCKYILKVLLIYFISGINHEQIYHKFGCCCFGDDIN